jgi:hypothetical protein
LSGLLSTPAGSLLARTTQWTAMENHLGAGLTDGLISISAFGKSTKIVLIPDKKCIDFVQLG